MASLEEFGKSVYGQIGLMLFRGVIVVLLGLLAWLGARAYDKLDSTVSQEHFSKTITSTWNAINKVVEAETQLTTNLSVLKAQFDSHTAANVEWNKSTTQTEADHETRLRQLEASKPRP